MPARGRRGGESKRVGWGASGAAQNIRGTGGIEPPTSRMQDDQTTLSENHTTRPSSRARVAAQIPVPYNSRGCRTPPMLASAQPEAAQGETASALQARAHTHAHTHPRGGPAPRVWAGLGASPRALLRCCSNLHPGHPALAGSTAGKGCNGRLLVLAAACGCAWHAWPPAALMHGDASCMSADPLECTAAQCCAAGGLVRPHMSLQQSTDPRCIWSCSSAPWTHIWF
jgi:hypothetical protein